MILKQGNCVPYELKRKNIVFYIVQTVVIKNGFATIKRNGDNFPSGVFSLTTLAVSPRFFLIIAFTSERQLACLSRFGSYEDSKNQVVSWIVSEETWYPYAAGRKHLVQLFPKKCQISASYLCWYKNNLVYIKFLCVDSRIAKIFLKKFEYEKLYEIVFLWKFILK